MVFILALLIGGAYLLAVWGIGAVWDEQDSRRGHGFGTAGVAIRQSDGSIAFHLTPLFDVYEFLRANAPPPADTMIVNFSYEDSIENRWWDLWSASRRVEVLEFTTHPSPRANGGPLTPDEQLRILYAIQRDHPEVLAPSLRHATSLRVQSVIAQSVYHNAARGLVTLLAIGGFVWGATWLTRAERRYRHWFLGKCATCGYTISGIQGDRCPECGSKWWPYGHDDDPPG